MSGASVVGKRCGYIWFPKGRVGTLRCLLDQGHRGTHMAWDDCRAPSCILGQVWDADLLTLVPCTTCRGGARVLVSPPPRAQRAPARKDPRAVSTARPNPDDPGDPPVAPDPAPGGVAWPVADPGTADRDLPGRPEVGGAAAHVPSGSDRAPRPVRGGTGEPAGSPSGRMAVSGAVLPALASGERLYRPEQGADTPEPGAGDVEAVLWGTARAATEAAERFWRDLSGDLS